jgi:hypothetical protein
LDQLWESAPKFPGSKEDRIDIDSFVQIYRDIDDLFEDEEQEQDGTVSSPATTISGTARISSLEYDDRQGTADTMDDDDDDELTTIFKSIADDNNNNKQQQQQGTTLSKQGLLQWDEVQSLMFDGLLDGDEFNSLWQKLPKAAGSGNDAADDDGSITIAGFVKFNQALDKLFEFEEDGEDASRDAVDMTDEGIMSEPSIIEDENLSAAELFIALADAKGLVGMEELKRWGELRSMLEDEDLVPLELENIFDSIVKADKTSNKLNKEGFLALYDKIDSLFEEEDKEENTVIKPESVTRGSGTKEQLLATLASINSDNDRLPCGLESTELEKKYVLELVNTLESEASNVVRERKGDIEMSDLAGQWELLYTSSAAMAYNKGLSGLGGSFPNGKFAGLRMNLIASKFLTDVEYTERIKVVPDSASFDVTVNGSWEIRSSVSIFTGEPSISLTVVPNKVSYGPTSTRADHWKSLGPTNMLDLSYLDDDLRVMRGNTSTDSILIFKRMK